MTPAQNGAAGLTSTADNTLRRKGPVIAGDPIGSDAFDPSILWDGFATDTFDGLGSHTLAPDTAPVVTASSPAADETDFPHVLDLKVTFNEAVNVNPAGFVVTCVNSGVISFTVSGGPTTYTINPDVDLPLGEACTLMVSASQVTDVDPFDPPDAMLADYVSNFTTANACQLTYTEIPVIQGTGEAVAIPGDVSTRGVVVGDFEGASPTLRGFYFRLKIVMEMTPHRMGFSSSTEAITTLLSATLYG